MALWKKEVGTIQAGFIYFMSFLFLLSFVWTILISWTTGVFYCLLYLVLLFNTIIFFELIGIEKKLGLTTPKIEKKWLKKMSNAAEADVSGRIQS